MKKTKDIKVKKNSKPLADSTKQVKVKLSFNPHVNLHWLIWSIEHNGWWAEGHRGYVSDVRDAGRYSFDEAVKIVYGANYGTTKDSKAAPYEAMVLDRQEFNY